MPLRPFIRAASAAALTPIVAMILAAAVVCPAAGRAAAERPTEVLRTVPLLPGLEARVGDDGTLRFVETADGRVLLEAGPQPDGVKRRSTDRPDRFTGLVFEGAPGGARGFSGAADDDGDRQFDEDRLDGLDNDGDGLVDEDFAAIGDAMTVIHSGRGRAARHLEYYHWAYPRLQSAVFLAVQGEPPAGGSGEFNLRIEAGRWLETDILSRRHTPTGRSELDRGGAFIARLDLVAAAGADRTPGVDEGLRGTVWVGVRVLEDEAADARLKVAGGSLDLSRRGDEAALVICAAESWLQLNRLLCEAARVHAGALDPVSGQRTRWIPPPPCSPCRLAAAPTFAWGRGDDGSARLTATITPGSAGLFDPDLFTVGGRPLGSPTEIRWEPVAGDPVSRPWLEVDPRLLGGPALAPVDPYAAATDLLGHQAAGRLVFRFAAPPADIVVADRLGGRWLDGRPLEAALDRADPAAPPTEVVAGSAGLRAASRPPTLAPDLLRGFPNPFQDRIQLRLRVPQTVGEAFFWEDDADRPTGLDLRAAVPWRGAGPQITLKIYSINGQELMTLFHDQQLAGETTVHWDGNDAFGRPVASGTYFCKLQMDEWSVTRRIVFLR